MSKKSYFVQIQPISQKFNLCEEPMDGQTDQRTPSYRKRYRDDYEINVHFRFKPATPALMKSLGHRTYLKIFHSTGGCKCYVGFNRRYRVDQKKVNLVLDQLETCGFLQGVQHVSNNTSIVKFDIAKF